MNAKSIIALSAYEKRHSTHKNQLTNYGSSVFFR
ncbi:MAG: hypothetical protein ACI8QF_000727 [Limisphaerales bacterium]|jgi:hypothetical protein